MKKILKVSFPLGLILLVTGLLIFLVFLFASLVGFLIGDSYFHNPAEFRSLIASTGMVPLLVLSILMYLVGAALILYPAYDRRRPKSDQPPQES